MWNAPEAITVAIMAIVAGLVGFSVLLLWGVALVGWLRLPQDPPDVVRYEPPPPPMPGRLDRAKACATALVQAELRLIYGRAFTLHQAAAECMQMRDEWKELPAKRIAGLEASVAVLERCGAVAKASEALANQELFSLDRMVRDGGAIQPKHLAALTSLIAAQEIAVQGVLAHARACMHQLPKERNLWRYVWLVLLLVFLGVWSVYFALRASPL